MQPAVTWLWRRAVDWLKPSLAVDAGANYGEIGLCTRYPPGCSVVLVEANPDLIGCLGRSVDRHRDRHLISVAHALVSDGSGVEPFFVDLAWSGTSAAGLPTGTASEPGSSRRIELPSLTLDALLAGQPARDGPARCVVFKLDLEGYEPKALRGFAATLHRSDFVGIVEFDTALLVRSEITASETLALLSELGEVRMLDDGARLLPLRDDFVGRAEHVHCDLVVASRPALLAELEPTPRASEFLHWASGPWARGVELAATRVGGRR